MQTSTVLKYLLTPVLLLGLFCMPQARAQLSGTYTIDANQSASSTNYKSFTAAVSDLRFGTRTDGGTANGAGVSGPVTFNVADGSYVEQIELKAITGASATSRITFQGASGDSTKARLSYALSSTAGSNYLIYLNGADFITFKHLDLRRTGTGTYGHVVVIDSGACDNFFLNNSMRTESNTSFDAMPVFSYNALDHRNVFRSNHFHQGYYSIFLWINPNGQTGYEEYTIIENNICDSAYFNAIAAYQHKAPVIRGNIVNHLRYSPGWGIRVLSNDSSYIIANNKIILNSGGNAILLYNATGNSSSNPSIVSNNMISINGTGASEGIYLNDAQNVDIVYNTVRIESSTTGEPLYAISTGSIKLNNIRFYNNIFAHMSGGYVFEIDATTASGITASNHNDLYTTGTLGSSGGTAVATLAALQSATGRDGNSKNVNPEFYSLTDLHVKAADLDEAGTPLSNVTSDFDGQARSSSKPDIGADEFVPPPVDLVMVSFYRPADTGCGDSATSVAVIIKNSGTDTLKNFTVQGTVSGTTNVTLSATYSGSLASKKVDTVYLSPQLNTWSGGQYNLTVYAGVTNDVDRRNDTIRKSIKISAGSIPPKGRDTAICGGGTVKLKASTSEKGRSLRWSETPNGKIFGVGDSVTVTATKTDTFYVEAASGAFAKAGPADSSIGNGGYVNFTYDIYFDTYQDIVLDSVLVHASKPGSIVVQLYDANSTQLSTGTFTISRTGKNYVPLNFKVPTGKGYILRWVQASSTTDLWRNYDGGNYPYTAAGFFSITGNGFSSSYHYFFYNWHVSAWGCPSKATPVILTVNPEPAVAFTKGSNFQGIYNSGASNNPDLVCVGSTITYDLAAPSGLSNADYGKTWTLKNYSFATAKGNAAQLASFNTPTGVSNASISFTPTTGMADSTFIITLTAANLSTGCDSTVKRYVKVTGRPKASFAGEIQCLGNVTLFTDSSVVGTPTATYYYNFGDGNSTTTSQRFVAHKYANAGSYVVWMKVVNTGGCPDSTSLTVQVMPNPVSDFTVPANGVCAFEPVTLVNKSSIPSGNLHYKWYFGDGRTDTVATPMPKYTQPGTYTISLAVRSDFGCKDSITRKVTILDLPNALFFAKNTCAGEPVNLSNSTTNAATYKWSTSDGQTSTHQTPNFIFPAGGNYTITLIATSSSGCVDTTTGTVLIFSTPSAGFVASDGCEGDAISFANTSTSADQMTYLWDFGNGVKTNAQNPTQTYTKAGAYTVWLKVITSAGCLDSVSQTVTIGSKPVAGFEAKSGVCTGTPITFTDTSSTSLDAIQSWNWTFGDGNTSAIQHPVHTYTTPGTYSVKLEAATATGCSHSVTRTVVINGQPAASFTAPTTICTGEQVSLVNSSQLPGGTPVYGWSFGDGKTSTEKEPKHIYTKAGTYEIVLGVAGSGNCVDTMRKTIQVYYQPDAEWSATVAFRTVKFMPKDTTGVTYSWDFGDGNTSTEMKPEYRYSSGFNKWYTVKLTVSGGGGCDATFTDSVLVGTTGIGQMPTAAKSVKVFPNPFHQELSVQYELIQSARVSISLHDMAGREVFGKEYGQQQPGLFIQVLSPELPEGQYILRLRLDDGVVTEQVIKVE